jgi:hypothetical protein
VGAVNRRGMALFSVTVVGASQARLAAIPSSAMMYHCLLMSLFVAPQALSRPGCCYVSTSSIVPGKGHAWQRDSR